jgi:two-component system, NarL family, sensor histidine kinase BarA
VNRLSAIDAPVALSDLLGDDDLVEVLSAFSQVHEVGIAIQDRRGGLRAAVGPGAEIFAHLTAGSLPEGRAALAGGAHAVRRTSTQDGDPLAYLLLGPYRPAVVSADAIDDADDDARLSHERAAEIADHVGRVIDVLLHTAYARYLTATVHVASMDEAFAEMREKNERLSVAIERMQEVDRLKTSFLATVSHELRTPLTSVIGYSEMLLEGLAGELNDEQSDYVRTILAKADQLLQLITGILDASMIESGQMRIAREPVILAELVGSVLSSFTSRAMKRRITVSGPDGSGGVPRACGDAAKIRQIIWNLVANAIKFTPEGGSIAIDLEVGPMAPGDQEGRFGAPDPDRGSGHGLRLVVRDSGIGISPEKQAHIFEPFFQVDSSSTREYGGTGLGLTLAKSYVEAHGGHIWVDSKLGAGSIFTITLPAIPDDLEAYLATCSTT